MQDQARPNVVVVVADTFRRDHLGAYGNPDIHTPNLDAFARSSVVFDQHVISSFPTMPARADMLTGNFSYTFMGWEPLWLTLHTLPGLLSSAGYTTMGVVDTPYFIRNRFGYDRGFDDFIWIRGQGDDTRPHERSDYRSTWRSESDRLVARTVTEAENWLERHYDEQFFLYVDTWDPHEPWDAPEYYTARYREGYEGEQIYPAYGNWKKAGLEKDDVDLGHATYCGEVSMVDFWVGRLLAKLDALGLRENTLVFFTSDHGFYFGEHDYFGKAEWVHDPEASVTADSSVPEWLTDSWLLTVERSPLYKELTNVPLMVRGPGLEPGHTRAMTTAPDLAPTIMDLVGLGGVPTTMTGDSFGGVLYGTREEHRPLVISSCPLYLAEGEIVTAIDSKARRIVDYMPVTITTPERSLILGGPDDEPELYDLTRDPGEQENVWRTLGGEGALLAEQALTFLEGVRTPEEYLAPRRESVDRWRVVGKSA
ncbi:MAG: sulfatase [Rubrobacteraceae bacterium]|nr:sulfatase [Rubrobacteraceae bacterium]